MTRSFPSCRRRVGGPAMNASQTASVSAASGSLLENLAELIQQLGQLQELLDPATAGGAQDSVHMPRRHRDWVGCCEGQSDPAISTASDLDLNPDPTFDFAADPETTPWDDLSVVELRSLLRCYPIDRRHLPAPIEVMRRHELITALNALQPLGA